MATKTIPQLDPLTTDLDSTALLEISQSGESFKITLEQLLDKVILENLHNELGGLQGGAVDEYYHLKAQTYGQISSTITSIVLSGGLSVGGVTINEFSTDPTLGGNSNTAVPTEQAVKRYVDNNLATQNEHNELPDLQGGWTDGTNTQYFHLTAQLHDQLSSSPTAVYALGNFDVAGHVAIGADALIDYGAGIPILLRIAEARSNTYLYGIFLSVDNTINDAGAQTVGISVDAAPTVSTLHDYVYGVSSITSMNVDSATFDGVKAVLGNANITGDGASITGSVVGGDFGTFSTGNNTTIVLAAAGLFRPIFGSSQNSIITNSYGILIESTGSVKAGSGTAYGLYIEEQASANFANNYNLYSAGPTALNYFEGDVQVDGTLTASTIVTDATTVIIGGINLSRSSDALGLAIEDEKIATQAYVDAQIGLGIETGNLSLSDGDTTASVVFVQLQGSTKYSLSYSLVNTVDVAPSAYGMVVFDKAIDGFSVLFSSPIDSDNYQLSWIVVDAELGSSSSSSSSTSSSSTSFSPAGIADLELWLASDTGVTTSGSDVTGWADQSGNGYDFSDNGNPPQFISSESEINDKPVIKFETSDQMFLPYNPYQQVTLGGGSNSMTMFVVLKTPIATYPIRSTSDNDPGVPSENNSNEFQCNYGNGALFNWKFGGSSWTPEFNVPLFGDYHSYCFKFDQSSPLAQIFEDGVESYSDSGAHDPFGVVIGCLGSASNSKTQNDIRFAEIICYSRGLSDIERGQVDNYLMTKYDFPDNSVDYTFNSYQESVPPTAWTNDSQAVDGNTGTYANGGFNAGGYLQLDGNDCPGTNLGTIRNVKMRMFHLTNNTSSTFTPYFGGSNAGTSVNTRDINPGGSSTWTNWIDITDDTNAPGSGNWTWADVQNLDVRLDVSYQGSPTFRAYKVDIRVLYD
jgi:hypothetical protein